MAITEGDVSARLATVVDPNLGKDLVAGKLVRAIRVDGGDVTVDIQLGYPASPEFFVGADPRSDPRILQSLRQAGKLSAAQATP